MKKGFIIFYITLFALFIIYGLFPMSSAEAKVTGLCANCHTMHNSQNGTSVLMTGTGVGWNSSDELSGGSLQSAPAETLLVTSCVGCHSSSSGKTIISIGGSSIPIVYNSIEPTDNILAGGNFYWVATQGDEYGHNVYGIANPDSKLDEAPGFNQNACNGSSCHKTLAEAPDLTPFTGNAGKGGCQGCHVYTAHHDDTKPWYRFLKGHNSGDNWVVGGEDSDWEQTIVGNSHNWYKGKDGPILGSETLSGNNTISAFCGGCHINFHRADAIRTGSIWVRHPTDIALPQGDGSEYAAYDPTTSYSTEAPVAWTDPTNTDDRGTPIVMCLSCHRPHGSDQPDMLRWLYSGMIANGGTNSNGCFTCHTTKDDGA